MDRTMHQTPLEYAAMFPNSLSRSLNPQIIRAQSRVYGNSLITTPWEEDTDTYRYSVVIDLIDTPIFQAESFVRRFDPDLSTPGMGRKLDGTISLLAKTHSYTAAEVASLTQFPEMRIGNTSGIVPSDCIDELLAGQRDSTISLRCNWDAPNSFAGFSLEAIKISNAVLRA